MHATVVLLLTISSAPATASDVAHQLFQGDARGALTVAERILAERPDDDAAELVAICAAIETGDFERARVHLGALERLSPVPPRVAVLRRLIDRRARSASGPLMEDLLLAWRDAGRPDLSSDRTLPDLTSASLEALPTGAALTVGERFVLGAPGPEERRKLALAAAADARRNAYVTNVHILGSLAAGCTGDDPEAAAVVSRVVSAAQRADPENGYIGLAGWFAGCPQRLDADGVALLSRAAAERSFGFPRQRVFHDLLALAERADPSHARHRAIVAWLNLDGPLFLKLPPMAEAINDPGLRHSAGEAIAAIGLRLADGEAWLERLVGLTLAQKGARLSGDDSALERARARAESERHVYQVWSEATRLRGHWPFAAEWREWSPDEVGRARAMVRLLEAE